MSVMLTRIDEAMMLNSTNLETGAFANPEESISKTTAKRLQGYQRCNIALHFIFPTVVADAVGPALLQDLSTAVIG